MWFYGDEFVGKKFGWEYFLWGWVRMVWRVMEGTVCGFGVEDWIREV